MNRQLYKITQSGRLFSVGSITMKNFMKLFLFQNQFGGLIFKSFKIRPYEMHYRIHEG